MPFFNPPEEKEGKGQNYSLLTYQAEKLSSLSCPDLGTKNGAELFLALKNHEL
jgi:hypothetical protein